MISQKPKAKVRSTNSPDRETEIDLKRLGVDDRELTGQIGARYRINDKWSVGASLDRHFDVGEKNETGEGDMDVLALRLERRFGG